MERQLGKSTLEDDARRLLTWVREQAGGLTHNILSATHPDTIAGAVTRGALIVGESTPKWNPLVLGTVNHVVGSDGTDVVYLDPTLTLPLAPVAQNDMIIANATPAWSILTGPSLQHQRLSSGASPFVPVWTVNLEMADDAWIGLGAAAGRLVFDSTPTPDEIRLVDGVLDLNGIADALVLDGDGDTSISAPTDDQIDIEIAGADDFTFTADSLNVLASSFITMADDTWIGAVAGGRLIFDLTPTPNQIEVTAADLYFATTAHGIIHVDGNTAGYVLRADGTRYIPADPTTTLPLAPVAQGDLIIANATPAWSILTLGAAAGYALVSTATTAAWDQTPTWTGDHVWDDGAGDSPAIKFVGGSNDDTISIFLDDDGTATDSDLVVKLCDASGDSQFIIQDSGGNLQAFIDSDGYMGIGTAAVPHGGVGWAKVAIEGANAAAGGPHMQFTTATDNYPLMQIFPLTHDNLGILFDAYYDGAFKSSDAGSNFLIYKNNDTLQFRSEEAIAVGNVITWFTSLMIDAGTGSVNVGTATPGGALLHVDQVSTTGARPTITLVQRDVSEEVIQIISSAAAGVLTNALVDEGDQASETRAGWLKISVTDDGNQIADGAYHVPFYSLAA